MLLANSYNCGASSAATKLPNLEGLAYLEKNFPALSLLDTFTKTIKEYSGDFAARKLKKHNKVVSKR